MEQFCTHLHTLSSTLPLNIAAELHHCISLTSLELEISVPDNMNDAEVVATLEHCVGSFASSLHKHYSITNILVLVCHLTYFLHLDV